MEDWFLVLHYARKKDFDPIIVDSIYGATAESSHEREVSAQDDDEPMRIHMNNHQEEDALKRERNLKMHGSNNAPHQEVQNLHNMMILNKMLKTINKRSHQRNVQDDPMGEEVVNLWEAEDPPDEIEDPFVEQATRSSISASNPWVLYEAGIICARQENGEISKNSSGEKVIVLREWNLLLSHRR